MTAAWCSYFYFKTWNGRMNKVKAMTCVFFVLKSIKSTILYWFVHVLVIKATMTQVKPMVIKLNWNFPPKNLYVIWHIMKWWHSQSTLWKAAGGIFPPYAHAEENTRWKRDKARAREQFRTQIYKRLSEKYVSVVFLSEIFWLLLCCDVVHFITLSHSLTLALGSSSFTIPHQKCWC